MILFHSSAMITYLEDLKGADVAELYVDQFALSSVSWQEVCTYMHKRHNLAIDDFEEMRENIYFTLYDHTEKVAQRAAFLYAQSGDIPLSLGDCACLAMAQEKRLPVLTAEKSWADLPFGLDIRTLL